MPGRRKGIRSWAGWIQEDPISRPYRWLRPELVPSAFSFFCHREDIPSGSRILVEPALVDA